jgi:hypothetical protein
MFNLDLSWIIGGVAALVTLIGGWLRVRSAKKQGIEQGRNEIIEKVEKADAQRASDIRERVEAARQAGAETPSGDGGDNGAERVRGSKKPVKPARTGRGYRD